MSFLVASPSVNQEGRVVRRVATRVETSSDTPDDAN